MNITERQHDYLRAVSEAFTSTGLAVGVTSVAERLGVSKVSAHETLNLLADRGCLRRESIGGSRYSRFLPAKTAARSETIRLACQSLQRHGEHDIARLLAAI